jgi:site-specific DNA recombinase
LGVHRISEELAKRQILPPTGGRYWATSTLLSMLKNETYAGVWHYNKKVAVEPKRHSRTVRARRRLHTSQVLRPRDEWIAVASVPAIIERDQFEAVQLQLARNYDHAKRNRRRFYLLSGLCDCGVCGKRLYGLCIKARYPYYRCVGTHRKGPAEPTCHESGYAMGRLDQAVWSNISAALRNPSLLTAQMEGVKARLSERGDMGDERSDLDKRIASITTSESRLLDAYSAGAVTLVQLQEQMGRLRRNRELLEERLKDTEPPSAEATVNLQSVEQFCGKVARGLEILEQDPPKQQEFLRSIVDRIVVEGNRATIYGAIPAVPTGAPDLSISVPSP